MAIALTHYFKVNPEKLEEYGVLNAYIGLDSKLVVDPNLLRRTKIPEFVNAGTELASYFNDVIRLLKLSKGPFDAAWREARDRLRFKEEMATALGYSGAGTSGKGIGATLATVLVQRAKEIIELGIDEPEIFELIGLFTEDFGPDL